MDKPPPTTPEEHIAHAWELPTPNPTPTRLTAHQRQLIETLASNPMGIHARATEAMRKWSARKAQLEPIQRHFHSTLPADRQATPGPARVPAQEGGAQLLKAILGVERVGVVLALEYI